MRTYQATARNFAHDTENRIHSDDVAAQFGFAGALVAGAAVFGHMTRPLVEALGTDWLSNWAVDVRFLKPAYHGDALTIRHAVAGSEHTVRCHARGVLLAELTSTPGKRRVGTHRHRCRCGDRRTARDPLGQRGGRRTVPRLDLVN